MKNFCFRAYKSCLRSLGHYGILLSLISAAGLYVGWTQGFHIGPLVVMTLIALGLSLIMCISKWTPNWLADPNSMWAAFVIFVGSGPLILLFGLVAMGVTVSWGLEASVGKLLSIIIALPAFALGQVVGWSALFYGILPDKSRPGPPDQASVLPPSAQPTTSVDLRALRQSRMSR